MRPVVGPSIPLLPASRESRSSGERLLANSDTVLSSSVKRDSSSRALGAFSKEASYAQSGNDGTAFHARAGGKGGLPLKQPLLVGTSQAAMHEQIRGRD